MWSDPHSIYVAEFSNGCVKVGITSSMFFRRSALRSKFPMGAARLVRLTEFETPLVFGLANLVEQSICRLLSEKAERTEGREWFYGVSGLLARETAAHMVRESRTEKSLLAMSNRLARARNTDKRERQGAAPLTTTPTHLAPTTVREEPAPTAS